MNDSRRNQPPANRAPLMNRKDKARETSFTIITRSIPPELTNGLAAAGGVKNRPQPNFSVSNAADAGDEIKQIDPYASLTTQQRLQLFSRTGGQGRTFTTSSEPNTQTWSDGSNNNDTDNIPSIVNNPPPLYNNSYGDEQSRQTSDLSYTNTYQAAAAAQAAQSGSSSSSPSTRDLVYENYPEIIVKSNGHVTQPDWDAWSKVTTQAVNLSSEGEYTNSYGEAMQRQTDRGTVDKRPADAAQFYNPITHSPTLDRIKNGHDNNDNISTEEITEQVESNIRILNELDNEYKTILERWHDFNGNINTSTAKIKELNFNSDIQYSIARSLYELALRPENYQFDYLKNFFPNIEHRDAANNLISAIDDPYSLMKAIYESASNSNPNGPDGHDISAAEPRYVTPVAYTENNASLETFAKNEEYKVSQFDSRYAESNYTLSESDYENLALNQNYNYITMYNVGDFDLQDAFSPTLYESSDNSVFKELIELINESQNATVESSDNFAGRMKEVYDNNTLNGIYSAQDEKHYTTFFKQNNQYPSSLSEYQEYIINDEQIRELDDKTKFLVTSMYSKWEDYIEEYYMSGQSFGHQPFVGEVDSIVQNMLTSIGFIKESINSDTVQNGDDYISKFYSSFDQGSSFVDNPSYYNIALKKARKGYNVGQILGRRHFINYSGSRYETISDNPIGFFLGEYRFDQLENELDILIESLENAYLPGLSRINQPFLTRGSLNTLLNQNVLVPNLDGIERISGNQLRPSRYYQQDVPGSSVWTFYHLYVDNVTAFNGNLPSDLSDPSRFAKGYIAGVPIEDIERQASATQDGPRPPRLFSHQDHDFRFLIDDYLKRGEIQNIAGNIGYEGQTAGTLVKALQDYSDPSLGGRGSATNETQKKIRSYDFGKEQFFPFLIETDNRKVQQNREEIYCSFQALINHIGETSNPTWQPRHFFGRTEQIHTYIQTERNIDLGITIYADTMHELQNLKHRVNFLMQQTYGQYNDPNSIQDSFVSAGPIVRLTLGDLYVSLPGIISSLNVVWDGPGGSPRWEMTRGLMIPWICNITMTYKVMHNEMPHRGYDFYWAAQYGMDGGHQGDGSNSRSVLKQLIPDRTQGSGTSRVIPGIDQPPAARQ